MCDLKASLACHVVAYVFFPVMWVRSRQPVKWYKRLIAHNFPRSQNCDSLEQRRYKELGNGNFP
ncbi:hypothetical protein OROMI_011055 [Orobanche minor]